MTDPVPDTAVSQLRVAIAFVALVGAWDVQAQSCETELFTSVLQTISGDGRREPRLMSCGPMPGHPEAAVAVFAFERASSTDEIKTYDVELAIVDARTAKPEARLSLRNVWESDAYKIDSVEISEVHYPVRRGARVFALVQAWSGSSNVSFYSVGKLGLFEQRGTTIVPLLVDLAIDVYRGEGCDTHTTRSLRVQGSTTKGYAPIVVSEVVEGIAREDTICPPTPSAAPHAVLTYRNGRYAVPKRLQP